MHKVRLHGGGNLKLPCCCVISFCWNILFAFLVIGTNILAYRQWVRSGHGSALSFLDFFWIVFASQPDQQSDPTCCLLHASVDTREDSDCVAETQHLLPTNAVLDGPNAVVKFQCFTAYGVRIFLISLI